MAKRRVERDLIAAAIQMFGQFTYEGVTTRGLAETAHCKEGGIYRIFGGKKGLYGHVIGSVAKESVDRMAEFALGLYSDERRDVAPAEIVKEAVRSWYGSMTLDGARLLQQVLLGDRDHRNEAQRALDSIVAILYTTLEPIARDGVRPYDAKIRSEALVWTLFQFKVSYAGPPSEEAYEVDRYLDDWLLTVGLGETPVAAA